MATVRTKKERFLPYAYERFGLQFRLERITVDGERLLERFDPDRRLVEMDDGWEAAEVDLSIEIPPALLDRLLPQAEKSAPPIQLLVAVRCEETRLRLGYPIAEGEVGVGSFPARILLRRADLSGATELVPFLVRARKVSEPIPGLATSRGARIASARPWELRVDRRRPLAGRYLDIRYQRFSLEEGIPKDDRLNLYRLECDRESPILWINADHQAIAGIMEVAGSVGRHARLREVIFDRVEPLVWTQLFLRAAQRIVEVGEFVYDWEEAALSEMLALVYPDAEEEKRIERFREEYGDLSAVLNRLDAALQRRSGLSEHLNRLIEAID